MNSLDQSRVLFLRKSNTQIGGVEMQMIRQARWLKTQGIADSVLATNDLQSPLALLFKNEGFEVWMCAMNGPGYMRKAVQMLRPLLKNSGVKILQAHMFRESIICRAVKFTHPNLLHYFRVETYIDCSPISGFKKKLFHVLAAITDSMVDHYFANGQLAADELINRSRIKADKVKVVYNGVESFGKPDVSRIGFDPDGCLRIIMVANLIRGKGHELLFQAIHELRKSDIPIRAYLYGDDIGEGCKQQLLDLSEKLNLKDRIVFCGFAANLREELEKFQVLVLPSDSEGTPNCVLEAMSTRKLVVVSDAGELPFIVQDGISGLVHPKGNQQMLMKHLQYAYNGNSDAIESMREAGLNKWRHAFSLDSMMLQLEQFYIQIK
ncbi:MAG: glycosyltransferase family 4 protein [Bacteroidota bacterium]|nr:glycosyltransferase family 4 protein [Bacteroidota bacterium]